MPPSNAGPEKHKNLSFGWVLRLCEKISSYADEPPASGAARWRLEDGSTRIAAAPRLPRRRPSGGHAVSVWPAHALSPHTDRDAPSHHPLNRFPGNIVMLQSHVIDIDGAFVGAAVRLDAGYRFIATDMRLDELDGSVWPSLADVKRLARRMYLAGRILPPQRATQH